MKKFLPIIIIIASFFISSMSFAVRTFTRDDAQAFQKEPSQQIGVPVVDTPMRKPVENLPNIKEQGEENEEIVSDPEENIKENIKKSEVQADEMAENLDNQSIKSAEESKEVEKRDAKKKANENVVKPQISGTGDYKTF